MAGETYDIESMGHGLIIRYIEGIEYRPTLRQYGLPVFSCMECGAVVVDWPDYMEIHSRWHHRMSP